MINKVILEGRLTRIAEEVHFAGKKPDAGGTDEADNNDVSDDYMPVSDDDLPF